MVWGRRATPWSLVLGLLMIGLACGDESGSDTALATTTAAGSTTTTTVLTSAAATAPVPTTEATTTTTAAAPAPLVRDCREGEAPAVAAYGLSDGAPEWSSCLAGSGYRALVAASDEAAYVVMDPPYTDGGSSDAPRPLLVALDATRGTELWRVVIAGPVPMLPGGSFLGGGLVVVAVADDTGHAVVALDASTGAVRWRVPTETNLQPGATLAHTDDVVVVQGPAFTTSGLDRATGKERWNVDFPSSAAAVDGDTVLLLPPPGGGPIAVDARTGAELYRAGAFSGDGVFGGAADGVVVWGGQDDPTGAFEAVTGNWLWTDQPGHAAYDNIWAVGDGAVYVVDSDIVAYDLATGDVRWRQADSGNRNEPWLVAGDVLFTVGNELAVLSTKDGSTHWSTPPPGGGQLRIQGVTSNTRSVFVTFGATSGD